MLSAGFAPLPVLKARLLPGAAAGKTDWDAQVTALGRGTAELMQRACSRTFERGIDVAEQYNAAASSWVVLRYPLESVSDISLITIAEADPVPLTDGSWAIDGPSGIVDVTRAPGNWQQKVRITYTGGYWLDPQDGTVIPDGATPFPDDLLEAWVMQCQIFAEARGLFTGQSLRKEANDSSTTSSTGDRIRLAAATLDVLRPYRRYGNE